MDVKWTLEQRCALTGYGERFLSFHKAIDSALEFL